eukprot:366430-Chlamydomonas_euryale.AAC.6
MPRTCSCTTPSPPSSETSSLDSSSLSSSSSPLSSSPSCSSPSCSPPQPAPLPTNAAPPGPASDADPKTSTLPPPAATPSKSIQSLPPASPLPAAPAAASFSPSPSPSAAAAISSSEPCSLLDTPSSAASRTICSIRNASCASCERTSSADMTKCGHGAVWRREAQAWCDMVWCGRPSIHSVDGWTSTPPAPLSTHPTSIQSPSTPAGRPPIHQTSYPYRLPTHPSDQPCVPPALPSIRPAIRTACPPRVLYRSAADEWRVGLLDFRSGAEGGGSRVEDSLGSGLGVQGSWSSGLLEIRAAAVQGSTVLGSLGSRGSGLLDFRVLEVMAHHKHQYHMGRCITMI